MIRCGAVAVALVAAVAALCGCPGTSDGVDAGSDESVDGGVADAGVLDLTRDPSCDAAVPWIAEMSGTIVDELGAALPDAVAQVCVRTDLERLLCLQPARAAADGAFYVVIPETARCMRTATARVLVPLADRATTYCALDLPTDSASLALDEPFMVFATTRPPALPRLGDGAVARPVTFAAGLQIDVVPEQMFEADYGRIAAARVDPAVLPACMLADAPAFADIYAFSPEADVDGAFALRLPNPTAIAAGAAVELFALGGLSCKLQDGTTVDEGTWARFGAGTVEPDGEHITVPASDGLPCFNWLAVR